MIPYIGDLSKNDAFLLRSIAEEVDSILEFGVGASTQILRHYCKGKMISVDTSKEWIWRTKNNMALVGVKNEPVDFKMYDTERLGKVEGKYDFIFVDGVKLLRHEFAINNWRYLSFGGLMAFHDTRKEFHIQYVSDIIRRFFTSIERVTLNSCGSNITIIKKCRENKYENWNHSEKRPAWQYGRGELDMKEFELYKKSMLRDSDNIPQI